MTLWGPWGWAHPGSYRCPLRHLGTLLQGRRSRKSNQTWPLTELTATTATLTSILSFISVVFFRGERMLEGEKSGVAGGYMFIPKMDESPFTFRKSGAGG